MPFIQTKVNVKIDKTKRDRIKTKLGEAIALIPGKTENWLMLSFEDECAMYFKGKDSEPLAFIEVKILGKTTNEIYGRLTAAIMNAYQQELGISQENIYVKYEEVQYWGWNGKNF